MSKEPQDKNDPLPGEHSANDPSPVNWNAYHANGNTLKMKPRSKDERHSSN